MSEQDGWEVWDGRDAPSDLGETPGRKRRGGWIVGLVVGGVLFLGAVGVAFYFLFGEEIPPPPVAFDNRPNGQFAPGRFGPGGPGLPGGAGVPDEDWTPADAETRRQVRAAFEALGRALQKPDFDPSNHFDIPALSSAVIDCIPFEKNWGQVVPGGGPGGPPGPAPVDYAWATRSHLREVRTAWRRRGWADANVRQVLVTDRTPFLGQVLLVTAWLRQPGGPPVKALWHFTRPDGPDGAWKVAQWEDAVTGMTGSGEVAIELIARAERRRELDVYRRLSDLHRDIDDGRFEAAERQLVALARTRPPSGLFADVCELAEAKLRLRRFDAAGAAGQMEAMAERPTELLPLVPLRAEAANLLGQADHALTLCERHTKRYGNDPAVLAHTAVALITLDRAADARPLAVAALADDPDQVVALNALRRLRGGDDPREFLHRVAATTRFPAHFHPLARACTTDRDWPALVGLAKECLARRPDDPSGSEALVRGLAEAGDTAAAVAAFGRHAPRLAGSTRASMVAAVTGAAARAGTAQRLYAELPDELRDEFFARLAGDLDDRSAGRPENDREVDTARRQLTALLAGHAARRPGDPVVALFEARQLTRERKWDAAAKKLASVTLPQAVGPADHDSLGGIARDTRLEVYLALKRWAAALDAVTPAEFALGRLAARCEAGKRWDDLAGLLSAYERRSADADEVAYWTGTLLAGRGEHAAAIKHFERLLIDAAKPVVGTPADLPARRTRLASARAKFARSAVKAGQAVAAVATLEAADDPPAVLFAFALAASGDVDRAIRYLEVVLEDNPTCLNVLFADPDLGPLLEKPAFADFRARHPRDAGPGRE